MTWGGVPPVLVEQSAALVRRSRAGDQNAQATIYRIGQEARKGQNRRAATAFALIQKFIKEHPSENDDEGPLPKDAPIIMATPVTVEVRKDPELRKPPLPRGALNGIFSGDVAMTILNAARYRHGLSAAAAVLASGPPLTVDAVKRLAATNFGSEMSKRAFLYGVQFCGEREFMRTAPSLEPSGRRCLAIGQCIGRARKLQMVRRRGAPISAYDRLAGWELGE
jgi:hypothetical protein